MNDLVVVATFTFPSELIVMKGRLESEGIECHTKDELTVQSHNFLSNAVGGVKLLVKQNDVIRARVILIEAGHLKESDFTRVSREKKLELFLQEIGFGRILKFAVFLLLLFVALIILSRIQ